MGVYIAEADLLRRMPAYIKLHLMDDDHDGAVDAATVAAIIDAAEGEFELIIGGRLTVPLTSAVRSYVVNLIADLASYWAHKRLHKLTDQVREDYEQARQHLHDAREGLIARDLEADEQVRPGRGATFGYADRVLGRENLEVL